MRDTLARSRNAFGERNGRSKITEEMARDIKIMLRDGIKPREIMNRISVSDKKFESKSLGKSNTLVISMI